MSGTLPAGLTADEKRRRLAQLLQKKAAEPKTFPVTFPQRRLWFLDRLEPGTPVYNIAFPVKLNGEVDPEVVERAVNEVVRRHEALRTVFREDAPGEPAQVVLPELAVRVPFYDLAPLTPEQRAARHRDLVNDNQNRPFDLAAGPLVRAVLLRSAPGDFLMMVCTHHIVSDGWSSAIFATEFLAIVSAFQAGAPSPLPPLPLQFADFAAWQRKTFAGEGLEAQLAWWRDHLEGAPEILELPTDHPRPDRQRYEGAVHYQPLAPYLLDGLQRLAREEGATLFMVVLAAFKSLLARYAGHDDIVVGTPIAGRTRPEVEPLVGFFVNTLALRTDLSGDPTFREAVRRVRDATLGAYAHQDMPFEKLVDELGVERSLGHSPVVQVMFSLANIGQQQVEAAAGEAAAAAQQMADSHAAGDGEAVGTEAVLVDAETRWSMFDLTLTGQELGGSLLLSFEYRTSLFERETIFRMAQHLQMLLERVVAEPDRRLGQVSLLPREERFVVVSRWNRTERVWEDGFQAVHRRIEAAAAATPHAPAVEGAGVTWSYAELNARANRLARRLRALGVGPERRVGVCLERSPEQVAAFLAAWKAGGAYVPLDPEYPRERLALLAGDARCAVIVTLSSLAERLPETGAPLLRLDDEALDGFSPHDLEGETDPGALAYVIYTSGSTGRPKGVMVPHGPLSNYVRSAAQNYRLTENDRVLQFASASFDASIEELYPVLTVGGTVVLRDEEAMASVPAFLRRLGQWRITVAPLPTAYWHEIVAQTTEQRLAVPPSLHTVVIGGERALPERVTAWQNHTPETMRLLNTYGPTETTVVATAVVIPHGLPEGLAMREPPIGRPIQNYRVYVLDAGGEPVPIGIPGELYVGGAGVARGYHGHPALTAERFVPDPFSGDEGARLYRTGDLVRWLPNGHLEFLGRTDAQVKVRGFRVELGEIEAALRDHPAVREAVVLLRDAGGGDRRLVAWFAVEPGAAPEASEVRAFLRRRLPGYMVPAALVPLAALPITPNGKLDRRALPAPDWGAADAEEKVGPRDDVEAVLAALWRGVLGAREVGVRDNFFELGGDSILSLQIVSRAAQQGLALTPRMIFEHQTVEELAQVVGRTAAPADAGPATGPVPATPIINWFFRHAGGNAAHWNLAVALELGVSFTPEAVEAAVRELVAHHDALRLRARPVDGAWTLEIPEADGLVAVDATDLSDVPLEGRDEAVREAFTRSHAALSLEDGPLVRAVLVRRGPGANDVLGLVAHHLVVDGVSWRVLMEDLETLLRRQRGEPRSLPPKTTSFRAWAERLAAHAGTGAVRDQAPFWLRMAEGPAPALPLDDPQAEDTAGTAMKMAIALKPDETSILLHDGPRAFGALFPELLTAALARSLAAWTGGDTAVVAQEGHGREDLFDGVDVSRTVGWFTSLYPLRFTLPAEGGLEGDVAAVKAVLREVPDNGLGYGLLRWLGTDEVAARLAAVPEPSVTFNYLGQIDAGGGGQGGAPPAGAPAPLLAPAQVPTGRAKDPAGPRAERLEINGVITGGQLFFEFEFGRLVFRPETVERLARAFGGRLREMVAHVRGGAAPAPEASSDLTLSQAELDDLAAELGDF